MPSSINPSLCALGIDLGGTNIRAGLFDANGQLYGEVRSCATAAEGPQAATLANLFDLIDDTTAHAHCRVDELAGIGIGTTGPLDVVNGAYYEPETLPNLYYFPLKDALYDRYNVPAEFTNDANAFALAEALFGAGRGHNVVVGVTLGTGCGCGIVIERRILEGATFNAGELYKAPLLGRNFDELLSGSGVARHYEERAACHKSAREIAALAATGDEVAVAALSAFGADVGRGLAVIASVIDPAAIILGGSVASAFRFFESDLRDSLAEHVAPTVSDRMLVTPSELGSRAGAAGGAALLFSPGRIG